MRETPHLRSLEKRCKGDYEWTGTARWLHTGRCLDVVRDLRGALDDVVERPELRA